MQFIPLDNTRHVKGRNTHYSVNQSNLAHALLSLSLLIPPQITLIKRQCLCNISAVKSHLTCKSKQELHEFFSKHSVTLLQFPCRVSNLFVCFSLFVKDSLLPGKNYFFVSNKFLQAF